jgi:uncharacterized protein YjeT (DUF2065 family)
MKWVLYLICMIWIVFGSFAILYTNQYRDMLRGILRKPNLKIVSFFPFVAGILLLFSSPASHYPWFIRLIGIFAIIKGVFIFTNPNGIANRLNHWYLDAVSDQTHRFFGIVGILLGSAVFSWIN